MENDQAARLRAMVRTARAVEAAGEGPLRLAIVSLEGMAPHLDVAQFVSQLVAATASAGVGLAAEGADSAPGEWVYSLAIAPCTQIDEACLKPSRMMLALSETTPSAVLATYALLKQLHVQGALPAIEVVFAGDEEECRRAADGLRGTCRRFLGWDALGSCQWSPATGLESLKGLGEQLARQVALAKEGNSPARNSLAEIPLEAV